MYRQQAERIRAIAQQVPLAETKVLLLKAALHLEERAQDEERTAQKLPLNPAPRTRDE
jgi:hypothetical protein